MVNYSPVYSIPFEIAKFDERITRSARVLLIFRLFTNFPKYSDSTRVGSCTADDFTSEMMP